MIADFLLSEVSKTIRARAIFHFDPVQNARNITCNLYKLQETPDRFFDTGARPRPVHGQLDFYASVGEAAGPYGKRVKSRYHPPPGRQGVHRYGT